MPIATKIDRFMQEGGWIRRMFETGIALKQQYGADKVFDLSLGNPVVEPPSQFREELRRLSQEPLAGMHRYMPNAGYADTRAAVAAGLRVETGHSFSAADIVMTCGAAGAINVVLKTLLEPGDEVVILSPYFVEYGYYADNHGGVPVVVPTDADFQPDLSRIAEALTERSRVLLINSPNNPSGAVYPEESLRGLADVLSQAGERFGAPIYLVSDEPYRRIIYDGLVYPQVFPHYEHSMVVNSHAKDLALPGERIGYIAVNPDLADKGHLVDGLTFCNRILGFVNAPALMQHVVRALQGVTVDVSDYQSKRDYLHGQLVQMGYSVPLPQGAFYLFPKSPVEDDAAFVAELQEWNVLTVPGRGFGTPGHFRISYCVEDWVIEGSLDGFHRVAEAHGLQVA